MKKKIILAVLLLGVLYRLFLTWDGNFLFNMDNARDMVDVREMVVLHKLRLTGPTSAIEGLFNGPVWYYLLAIPFILTGGELPAMLMIDVMSRQVEGVLGDFNSLEESRVANPDVYTRPEVLEYKGKKYRVPKILLSGHRAKIEEWKRRKQ